MKILFVATMTLFIGFLCAFGLTISASVIMPGKSFHGPLPPLDTVEEDLVVRLRTHVQMLATTIGPRSLMNLDNLDRSAQYVRTVLEENGYSVTRDTFEARGVTCGNISASLPGSGPEVLVVGAHYDSVPNSPAANDNGSGVAALLEIARMLAGTTPAATIRFVGFANEEPPYFQTDAMGSFQYARSLKNTGASVRGMISLETLGYYSTAPESQKYPPIISMFYPSTGDFIAFVGNLNSRKFVLKGISAFRESASFPSEGVAGPDAVPQLGLSDHWSFWQQKIPALMVTDTATFRYPHYHKATDTPDKLDYERMARVVNGLGKTIFKLAS